MRKALSLLNLNRLLMGKGEGNKKNYGNEFLTETNGAEDGDLQVGLTGEEISTRYF